MLCIGWRRGLEWNPKWWGVGLDAVSINTHADADNDKAFFQPFFRKY
jgi:hypothetical protein